MIIVVSVARSNRRRYRGLTREAFTRVNREILRDLEGAQLREFLMIMMVVSASSIILQH